MTNQTPVVKCDTPAEVFLAATTWLHAGFAAVPAAPGKRPGLDSWREYQQRLPTDAEIEAWFTPTTTGLGLVCGAVSGGLEMLELEGRVVEQARKVLPAALKAAGLVGVWERIRDGYCETTPGGGIHFLYRISDAPVPGNEKVARDPGGLVLVETRGEGGFVVVAPSHGATHPTGKPWVFCNDSYAGQVPTVTWEERVELHRAMAAVLDSSPEPAPFTGGGGGTTVANGTRPGDRWAAATPWDRVLVPHGWRWVYRQGDMDFWRRPGKSVGVSARTGGTHDGFWVWSTSTEFESERLHTKYWVHTLLNHGGDFDAATRSLPSQFRGSPTSTPVVPADPWIPNPVSAANGNGARAPEAVSVPIADPEIQRGHLRFAERFTKRYAGKFLYVHGLDWHEWDGIRWSECMDGAPVRALRDLLAESSAEAFKLDDDAKKSLRQDINRCEPSGGMKGVLEWAKSLYPCARSVLGMDLNRSLFNTPSGTLNLDDLTVHEPDPTNYMTKVSGAGLDSSARSTEWEGFLECILPDAEVRRFVQRLFGYAMLGKVREHVMPIFTGEGANGKGTLRDVIMTAFGDYAISINAELLMKKHNPQHLTFQMDLKGQRLVFCSETERGRQFDESLMKNLVGGDIIRANRMRENPVEFKPSHTLVMLTNHPPVVSGDDPAIWRRILVVPFDVVIPENQQDSALGERLSSPEHSAAVLNWCFEGFKEYSRIGLAPPDAVRVRTKSYRQENDVMGRFFGEETIVSPPSTQTSAALYARYELWCRENGEVAESKIAFGKAAKRNGLQPEQNSAGTRLYRGVLLRPREDETAPSWIVGK